MKENILNDKNNLQFQIVEGDDIAYLQYKYYDNSIALINIVVPKVFRRRGIASLLAAHAFDFAKLNSKPVLVYCSFIAHYLQNHPELTIQLDKEFHKS